MRKIAFYLLMASCLPSLCFGAAAEVIVADGTPKEATLIHDWKTVNGMLVGKGLNKYILSRNTFKPEQFTIEAEIVLDEFNATAATFILGKGSFGLDGGTDAPNFFEVQGEPVIKFNPKYRFTPGKPFKFRVEGRGGKVTFFADGNKLATVDIPTDTPICFGFRPQRNTIRIRNFIVNGTSAGANTMTWEQVLNINPVIPMLIAPLDCSKDAEILLKSTAMPENGNYDAVFKPLPTGESINFKVSLKEGKITIPSKLLTAAYAASTHCFALRPLELELRKNNKTVLVNRLPVYDPANKPGYPVCKVVNQNGHPCFSVNGRLDGTISARLGRAYGTQFYGRAIRQFADAGIHSNILILFPHWFMSTGKDFEINEKAFFKFIYEFVCRTVCEDPDAEFVFHWDLRMPHTFVDHYPDEVIRLDNGVEKLWYGPSKKLQPSYASKVWRKQMGKVLEKCLRDLSKTCIADRITHIKLLYANCGEWNHWGYHEKAFVDFSKPMQHAFGAWLKKHYGTTEALRKKWKRNDVDFDSENLIPTRKQRMAGPDTLRLGGPEQQSTVDYYAFFQEYAVRTIEYFAKIAREASAGKLLIGCYYGYYWGHYGNNPYHFQDSGNYGLRYLLESPWIDYCGGPNMYTVRRHSAPINGISKSLALHGKLWESEEDMRTHYSGKAQRVYGTTDSLSESIAVAKRDYCTQFAGSANYYFFDFVYNWYRDEPFMQTVKYLNKIDKFLRKMPQRMPAEIAVIVSEKTIPYLANTQGNKALLQLQQAPLNAECWGAPYDTYAECDLDKIDFAPYKIVVFPNLFYASDKTIKLIREKIMRDNRAVIFYFAPGLISRELTPDLTRSKSLTGIGISYDPEGVTGIVRKTPEKTPYIAPVNSKPLVCIDDSKAKVIAIHEPSGLPAGAMHKFSDHTSILICHPAPNGAFMRKLFTDIGNIHLYSRRDFDRYFFCGSMIGVFSWAGGTKELVLARKCEVIADMFSGEIIGRNTQIVRFTMPKKQADTKLIFTGTAAELNKFNQN